MNRMLRIESVPLLDSKHQQPRIDLFLDSILWADIERGGRWSLPSITYVR